MTAPEMNQIDVKRLERVGEMRTELRTFRQIGDELGIGPGRANTLYHLFLEYKHKERWKDADILDGLSERAVEALGKILKDIKMPTDANQFRQKLKSMVGGGKVRIKCPKCGVATRTEILKWLDVLPPELADRRAMIFARRIVIVGEILTERLRIGTKMFIMFRQFKVISIEQVDKTTHAVTLVGAK